MEPTDPSMLERDNMVHRVPSKLCQMVYFPNDKAVPQVEGLRGSVSQRPPTRVHLRSSSLWVRCTPLSAVLVPNLPGHRSAICLRYGAPLLGVGGYPRRAFLVVMGLVRSAPRILARFFTGYAPRPVQALPSAATPVAGCPRGDRPTLRAAGHFIPAVFVRA